jgi:polyvinyl alcohol dehydrogenase (cytochrome)
VRAAIWASAALFLAACGTKTAPSTPPPAANPDGGSGSVVPPAPDAGVPPVPDAGTPPPPPGPLGGGDWTQFRYDQRGASENPATFSKSEVPNITQAWTYDIGSVNGTLTGYGFSQAVATNDLIVYTTGISGRIIAIDPATGKPKWPERDDLTAPVVTNCEGSKKVGYWNSAAIVGDVVYVASPDGNVYALRKADGTTIWAARVADGSAAGHGEFIQSSPSVSTKLGRLYVGIGSSAHCDEIAGKLSAVDLADGKVQTVNLVNPGQQGAAVWSTVTIAEDENRIYVTTGNRIGPATDTPNSQAFLAMDPHSLAVLDRWQNPTPLENADFGASPTIFDAGGMKLIAATSKDGWLYVLRRDALSAGPVWKFQIAVIDPNDSTVGGDPTMGWGSISTPSYARGTLFAAGGKTPDGFPGSVVAFEPATGKVLWTHHTPGYVIAGMAVAGDILAVESSAVDGTSSTLELLDLTNSGTTLRSFGDSTWTYAAPSIAHGMILWTDFNGIAQALAVPNYRR